MARGRNNVARLRLVAPNHVRDLTSPPPKPPPFDDIRGRRFLIGL